MPESNCFCLLTTGGATCALAVVAGRALADDASISFCALCIVKSRKKNQRNPMELKGKSSSTTMKRIFSILRFLPVPGVSVRVAFRSSPDRYEPRNPSHLRPGREWSSLRWSRLARRGKFARRIFTRCPHVFEFLLLGIVLRFELVVERSTVVGLLWGFCKRE